MLVKLTLSWQKIWHLTLTGIWDRARSKMPLGSRQGMATWLGRVKLNKFFFRLRKHVLPQCSNIFPGTGKVEQ